jgi:hypothetical protein
MVIPRIDHPFNAVGLGSQGEEREGVLYCVDIAEKLEFLFGAVCSLFGIRFFY